MDKRAHTPGPWLAGQTITALHPERAPGSYDRISIAQRVNRLADARLIACAPDLLQALQSMVDAYQTHFDVMPVAWQTYDNIARAAIAKATGGE